MTWNDIMIWEANKLQKELTNLVVYWLIMQAGGCFMQVVVHIVSGKVYPNSNDNNKNGNE